jgi:secreted Zn-dependent insulinase-like peptidase
MLIEHIMNDDLYAAKQANYEIDVSAKSRGIELSITGYNEKIDIVLEVILKKMSEFEDLLSESAFDTYKKELKHDCHEEISNVDTQNREIMNEILDTGFSGCYQVSRELKNISIAGLKHFNALFLKKMKVKMLVQGNIKESQAIVLSKKIDSNNECNDEDRTPKARKIPHDKKILKVKSILHHNHNSAISNYYQLDKEDIKLSAELELFVALLKEPLFNNLRTQHQLGYVIKTNMKTVNNVLGFRITVLSQEDKNSYESVYSKMENFLKSKFDEILNEITEEEFESTKSSLIQKKAGADIELSEEVDRNWEEILDNKYKFDRQSLIAKAVEKLTLDDIKGFYDKKIKTNKLRELSIQVVGQGKKNDDDENLNPISNLQVEVLSDNSEEISNAIDRAEIITNFKDFVDSLEIYKHENELE